MARTRRAVKPLETLWEIPEPLWGRVLPILNEFWPRKATGRKVANWRQALNGIIFRMRSGCQWEHLPREFGPKSTVHDWFQRWCRGGVLERVWAALAAECDELRGVDWRWQAADGAMGKARFGGAPSARTRPTGPRRARRRACWSRPTAARWGR